MIDYLNAFLLSLFNVPYVGYGLVICFLLLFVWIGYESMHCFLILLKNRDLSETLLILILCIFILRVLFLTF